ncbi:hypothetical protein J3R73_000233 [Labrys monachus]|uniref:Lysozyme inhibitor LprI N-terminal domain-containing protein n=2 Tax=Labrys monachus TaxID=217067 RepID=A0ABU0F7A8_9HYPH|nr:hypothetical protein [Labrys monachus]
MGEAYATILKATVDAEIRSALVASQKRWLSRRDEQLGQVNENDASGEDSRGILLQAMQDRTRDLARRSDTDPKLPRLVAIMLEQQKFAAQFTGGAFAGFDTSCDFLPGGGRYSYGCFAIQHYQNRDRVCTLDQDWASGSVYEKHAVAEVVDGRLKTIATCSIGGDDDNPCPGAEAQSGQSASWNIHPKVSSGAGNPPAHPLPRLDADVNAETDAPWLHACLTDSAYPLADPASGGSGAP